MGCDASRFEGDATECEQDLGWHVTLIQLLAETPLPRHLGEALDALRLPRNSRQRLTVKLESFRSVELQQRKEQAADELGCEAALSYPDDFALAIYVYSLEDPVAVYKILNRDSLNNTQGRAGYMHKASSQVYRVLPLTRYLMAALRALPAEFRYAGDCYRFMKYRYNDAQFARFAPGKLISKYAFLSTAMRVDGFLNFAREEAQAGEDRTVLRVRATGRAWRVSFFCDLLEEDEVLFEPMSTLEVLSASRGGFDSDERLEDPESGLFPDEIAFRQVDPLYPCIACSTLLRAGDFTRHVAEHCRERPVWWPSSWAGREVQVNIASPGRLEGSDVALLVEAFRENPGVRRLSLRFGDGGAANLSRVLRLSSTLRVLDVRDNRIGPPKVAHLAEALKQNRTLTALDLGMNCLGEAGAARLAEALKVNGTLEALSLQYNALGDGGLARLAEALEENESLAKLDLADNRIGAGGAARLAEALEQNGSLSVLGLRDNHLGPAGAASLASALESEDCALELLSLANNQIGAEGAEGLARALACNGSLRTLNLAINSMGESGAASLAGALKRNTALTTLNLHYNAVGDAGAASLAEALGRNSSLTQLDVRDNRISEAGAARLAQALRHNSAMQKLVR